jgi:hypothetical protein
MGYSIRRINLRLFGPRRLTEDLPVRPFIVHHHKEGLGARAGTLFFE